jgi:protein-S-isoprenylcysteine O-methyltransferase Ste14
VTAGHFFFKHRSYTPVPFLILLLMLAHPTRISFFAGLSVALLGEAIRFWGVLYAGGATRTTAKVGARRLVTDGPFSHVRNPLYIGNFFLNLGIVIMSRAWWPWMLLVSFAVFGIQYGLIVREEERFLSEKFGAQYEEYCRLVPRWIPRLKGFSNSEPSLPVLKKALRSERNSLQAIVAVTGLILLRWWWF